MPLGHGITPPSDPLNKIVANLVTHDTASRNRLFRGVFISQTPNDALALCEKAFKAALQVEPLLHRLQDAIKHQAILEGKLEDMIQVALKAKILTDEEAKALMDTDDLVQQVIAADDFAPEELFSKPLQKPIPGKSGLQKKGLKGENRDPSEDLSIVN